MSTQIRLQNGNCSCANRRNLSLKIDEAAKILSKCTHDYAPDEIFISFNGGKDCTVLLDLFINYTIHNVKPIVIYIRPDNPFPDVDEFIKTCEQIYNVDIQFVRGKNTLKSTLEKICDENPKLKAVVMGCRNTDPYCEKLEILQYTDPGWPKLLRVNPLLNWTYKDIWEYIRLNNIKYCRLYDQGYTSIGDAKNTKPNENILISNVDGRKTYKPAWELEYDNLERSGRF